MFIKDKKKKELKLQSILKMLKKKQSLEIS